MRPAQNALNSCSIRAAFLARRAANSAAEGFWGPPARAGAGTVGFESHGDEIGFESQDAGAIGFESQTPSEPF